MEKLWKYHKPSWRKADLLYIILILIYVFVAYNLLGH